MPDDLIKTLDRVTTAATLTTQKNRTLKPLLPAPAIPARAGQGLPKLL